MPWLKEELPEELDGLNYTYDRLGNLSDGYEEARALAEQVEIREAMDRLESVEEAKMDAGLRKLKIASQTYETIQRLRDHERVEKEQLEELDRAERLLVEENRVEEASEIVEDTETSVKVRAVRKKVMDALEHEKVRKLIRDVIAEVIPNF